MNNFVVEYIWIDGYFNTRSKTRVLHLHDDILDISLIPEWNYDGSSTKQAETNGNTEVIIKPCVLYKDPFRKIDNAQCYMVLCDTYDIDDVPLKTNTRFNANNIFNLDLSQKPWFGLEQEFFLLKKQTDINLLENQFHYCGISNNKIERNIVEEHLKCCMEIGLNISGLNAEVSSSQWEFQIGPCEGIIASDQLYVARYLLSRIAEQYDYYVSYHPKLVKTINGSGCHTNFSTLKMREYFGLKEIYDCIKKLEEKHHEHINSFGDNNELRLTGLHETSSINNFNWGVGTRNTSIRIPNCVIKDGCGYFEDRRPASNMDPYVVTSLIFKTVI